MKKLKLFIALIAIVLGVSSCTSTGDTELNATLTTAYFVRTQKLVDTTYTYKYNPFFVIVANKNLVSATCTVDNKSYKVKKSFAYSFFSDYIFNTSFDSIEDLSIQFIVKDEDNNSFTTLNKITGIIDDMGSVNLTKLEYVNGVVFLTYDETENASKYVLTVRIQDDSYRRSFLLSPDHSYTLSNINIKEGTQLDVCLSTINTAGTVVADGESYTITVGTDFSTED